MKIRKATKKDLKEYIKMKEEGMKYFFKISGEKLALSKKKIQEEFEQALSKKNSYIFFMTIKGTVAGYIFINIIKKPDGDVSYLNDILVKKEFRGEGYGKRLMKEFIKFSKSKKKVKKIGLGTRAENKNAIKLYKKLGFKIVGYNFGMKLK